MKSNIKATALGISVVIVACLTLLSRMSDSAVFFYLLYPGMAISLLITGGHGGTIGQNWTGPVLGFIVNMLTYSVLCVALLAIFRQRNEERHS